MFNFVALAVIEATRSSARERRRRRRARASWRRGDAMRPKVRAALEAAQKPKPTTDATAADDRAPPPDDDAAPIVASSSPAPAPASDADADADAPRASLPFFGDQCAICQEDVSRRGRLDSCAHVFCVACIKRWAKIETRCPLCKARFSFIQPEDVDVDVDVAGEDGTSTDAKTKTKTTTTTRGGSRGGAKKPNKPLKRIYLPRRDQTYEDPDGGELPDGVDVETVLCGRCGETASRTTSFAKCTPFLKDFGLSPPALSFRRSFNRRDVRLTPTRRRFNPTRRRRRRG